MKLISEDLGFISTDHTNLELSQISICKHDVVNLPTSGRLIILPSSSSSQLVHGMGLLARTYLPCQCTTLIFNKLQSAYCRTSSQLLSIKLAWQLTNVDLNQSN
eukprot:2981522-Amphidinium_carterae.1